MLSATYTVRIKWALVIANEAIFGKMANAYSIVETYSLQQDQEKIHKLVNASSVSAGTQSENTVNAHLIPD